MKGTIFDWVTPSFAKRHYGIIPVQACVIAGVTLCAAHLTRLALKNPDVKWNITDKDTLSNDRYRNKNYKLVELSHDPNKYRCPAPDYMNFDDQKSN